MPPTPSPHHFLVGEGSRVAMLTLIALFVTGEFHATHIPFTSKNSHCTDGMGGKFPCLANNLSGVSDGKEPAYSAGDLVLIPGLERSPGEENVYPLQYDCLENSLDKGARQAIVHEVTKSLARLSDSHFHFCPGEQLVSSQS